MNVSCGYRKHGFDAYGGKYLRKEDMSYWMDSPDRTDPQGVALGLDEEIKEVEPDFFELLPTIDSLWIHNPECKIHMTDKTIRLFQDNRVLLRGVYDSVAKRLAQKYHLRILHLDMELVSVGDYFELIIYLPLSIYKSFLLDALTGTASFFITKLGGSK